jgi:hypothetical protein
MRLKDYTQWWLGKGLEGNCWACFEEPRRCYPRWSDETLQRLCQEVWTVFLPRTRLKFSRLTSLYVGEDISDTLFGYLSSISYLMPYGRIVLHFRFWTRREFLEENGNCVANCDCMCRHGCWINDATCSQSPQHRHIHRAELSWIWFRVSSHYRILKR